jgi:hypothetical protein
MIAQANALAFQVRVNLWCVLTGRGSFNWMEFRRRLEGSEFRHYANKAEAVQSWGWSGTTENGDKWLFAVVGYCIPLYGKSAMRHELFHAAQDLMTGLFTANSGWLRVLAAEYSAHLWGGPLIGIPCVYLPSLFIAGAFVYILYTLVVVALMVIA